MFNAVFLKVLIGYDSEYFSISVAFLRPEYFQLAYRIYVTSELLELVKELFLVESLCDAYLGNQLPIFTDKC